MSLVIGPGYDYSTKDRLHYVRFGEVSEAFRKNPSRSTEDICKESNIENKSSKSWAELDELRKVSIPRAACCIVQGSDNIVILSRVQNPSIGPVTSYHLGIDLQGRSMEGIFPDGRMNNFRRLFYGPNHIINAKLPKLDSEGKRIDEVKIESTQGAGEAKGDIALRGAEPGGSRGDVKAPSESKVQYIAPQAATQASTGFGQALPGFTAPGFGQQPSQASTGFAAPGFGQQPSQAFTGFVQQAPVGVPFRTS